MMVIVFDNHHKSYNHFLEIFQNVTLRISDFKVISSNTLKQFEYDTF